jgi:hypothetical protein
LAGAGGLLTAAGLFVSGCGDVGVGVGGTGLFTGIGVDPVGGFEPPPGVGLALFSFGKVKPLASSKAIGGSKTPIEAPVQVDHAGSKAISSGGIESCGVHRLVMNVDAKESKLQSAVHVHCLV